MLAVLIKSSTHWYIFDVWLPMLRFLLALSLFIYRRPEGLIVFLADTAFLSSAVAVN